MISMVFSFCFESTEALDSPAVARRWATAPTPSECYHGSIDASHRASASAEKPGQSTRCWDP
jgi:hypothetical protein